MTTDTTKRNLYIAAAILIAGIVIGLLVSGWAGAITGLFTTLFGMLGLQTASQYRQEREALQSRDKADKEKARLAGQERHRRMEEAIAREERRKARKAQAAKEDAQIREEGRRLKERELLEKAEREALRELGE